MRGKAHGGVVCRMAGGVMSHRCMACCAWHGGGRVWAVRRHACAVMWCNILTSLYAQTHRESTRKQAKQEKQRNIGRQALPLSKSSLTGDGRPHCQQLCGLQGDLVCEGAGGQGGAAHAPGSRRPPHAVHSQALLPAEGRRGLGAGLRSCCEWIWIRY